MGQREDAFKRVLSAGAMTPPIYLPRPEYSSIVSSKYAEEVMRVYKALGGNLDQFPTNVGPWDIIVNGVVIELDEDRHFNRYRRITLDSTVYEESLGFDWSDYITYCEQNEQQCLKSARHGGYWTNDSCERQFGQAGPEGILDGAGAPRWKQRAFYDFIKDLSPLVSHVSVLRVAIYEKVQLSTGSKTVNDILTGTNRLELGALRDLVMNRLPCENSPGYYEPRRG